MNKKHQVVLIVLIALNVMLNGQITTVRGNNEHGGYDEKAIMKKQAERYTSRREYEKANTIYREMIEKYPSDWQIVEKLLSNLLRVSEFDEVEILLAEKKDLLPDYNYLRIRIPLLIRMGEGGKAEKLADEYLKENRTQVNSYQKMSQIFSGSRQYEKASEILENARKITNDEYLFTLELARSYQNSEKNRAAMVEYLKHLERNKHYLHYVMNNLKGMLNRDKKLINTLADFQKDSQSPEVREVYALSLAHIMEYEEALCVFRELDTIKLFNFAEELYKSHQDEFALQAYQQYQQREKEPHLQAEAMLMKARIYIRQQELGKAEEELLQIYGNDKLNKGKYRYRSQVSQKARLLLADISIRLDRSSKIVNNYLEEAAGSALNDKTRKEIKFAAIDYRIKKNELEKAGEHLRELLRDEESGTDIYKLGSFYIWQISFLQRDQQADSLLGELILNLPQSELTTRALYLTQLITSLPQEYHKQLFTAWNQEGLYKTEEALEILKEIITATGNDEMKLLAAEWMKDDKQEEALFWWKQEYNNELLSEFAQYKQLKTTASDSLDTDFITGFLKERPQSIFAPAFRMYLQKAEAGRPQYEE